MPKVTIFNMLNKWEIEIIKFYLQPKLQMMTVFREACKMEIQSTWVVLYRLLRRHKYTFISWVKSTLLELIKTYYRFIYSYCFFYVWISSNVTLVYIYVHIIILLLIKKPDHNFLSTFFHLKASKFKN